MSEPAQFNVNPSQFIFLTKQDGDRVTIEGLHLTADTAANLARLVNQSQSLKVEIKIAGE